MKKVMSGAILIGIGAFLFLGFFLNALKKGVDAGDIALMVIFCIAPITAGGLLIRSHLKEKRTAIQNQKQVLYTQREKEIIRLAQQTGGRLSIPDIVAGTSMNTIEADAMMREMTTKGYVDMQVTEAGVIVYEFFEIVHREP